MLDTFIIATSERDVIGRFTGRDYLVAHVDSDRAYSALSAPVTNNPDKARRFRALHLADQMAHRLGDCYVIELDADGRPLTRHVFAGRQGWQETPLDGEWPPGVQRALNGPWPPTGRQPEEE